jgi:hypothetical protein
MNASGNSGRRRRPPCGPFTWGRWLPQRSGPRAALILLASYALGFALPITGAIQSLVSAHHGGHATTSTDPVTVELINDAVPLAISLFAAVLGMRTAERPPLNLTPVTLGIRADLGLTRARKSATTVVYAAVLIMSVQLSLLILDAAHVHQDAATGTTDRLPALAVSSGWAGLLEEPILLGLTLGLAARLLWRWYLVLPLMITMRIAFHVYYGAGALFVIFWMGAAYVLYRGCPLLWPFIVGHGVFDVLQVLSDGPGARATTFTIIEVVVAAAGVVLAAPTLRSQLRNRSLEPAADVPA